MNNFSLNNAVSSDLLIKAGRKSHPENTVIEVSGAKFGDGSFPIIAGPCSIESEAQIIETARKVKAAGASLLRGGAFKPRTSPYDFQGLHADGIRFLLEAKKECNIPVVSEIMSISHLDLYENIDIIQVGARNMQNYDLLRELGKTGKTILLKRGISATIEEFLMSAEYILSEGNSRVILCERGIRTYEPTTRNTLDISAVPMLHELTHLPVIVDPSHSSGHAKLVKPLALAAAAVGADGLMVEVHPNPSHALSDGEQAVTPDEFADIAAAAAKVRSVL